MPMPETAMHEDDLATAPKYKVWASGKALVVKTIAVAHPANETTDDHFGLVFFARTRPIRSERAS
jgi:hypothetical protein